jgi:thymidylate synthase (FAD)
MARVSAPQNQDRHDTAPKLIGYLIKNRHWSPFEMVSVCVEIETTRDISRQILRHRMFFQEFSQRYATTDALPVAPLREARMQDTKNRQNSVPCENDTLIRGWEIAQENVRYESNKAYQWAIENGIAKEVARAVLPEGLTMTRMYCAGTIRNWLHFCDLRRGNGTQKETREIADKAWEALHTSCPMICEAWEKHQ